MPRGSMWCNLSRGLWGLSDHVRRPVRPGSAPGSAQHHPDDRRSARDELAEPTSARSWLEAHGGRGSTKELTRVRDVRAVLQSLVRGEKSAAALAPYVKGIGYRP